MGQVEVRFMRFCLLPLSALRVFGCVFAFGMAASAAHAAPQTGPESRVGSADFEPSASLLRRLKNAEEVELWLAREIPQGLTLAEAPEFFAAADEVFFNAEENLYVYAYRSAETGRWIAWVAFDADRSGVVHTAAINLDR